MSIEAARMAVLNLVAERRIGPEEARLLLEALDAKSPPAAGVAQKKGSARVKVAAPLSSPPAAAVPILGSPVSTASAPTSPISAAPAPASPVPASPASAGPASAASTAPAPASPVSAAPVPAAPASVPPASVRPASVRPASARPASTRPPGGAGSKESATAPETGPETPSHVQPVASLPESAVLQRDRGMLELSWQGLDGDQVGPNDQGRPDGQNDGQFRLTLELPSQARLDWIELRAATSAGLPTGQLWHSADRHGWILGVVCRGKRLNETYQRPLGVFSGRTTFELYGADAGGFQVGAHFLVRAQLNGNQILEGVVRVEPVVPRAQPTDWGQAYARRPDPTGASARNPVLAGGAPGVSVSTIPGSRLSSPRVVDPVPEEGAPTVPGVSIIPVPAARPGARPSSSPASQDNRSPARQDGATSEARPQPAASERTRRPAPGSGAPSRQPEQGRRRLEVGVTSRAWPTGTVRAASGGSIEGPAPVSSSQATPSSPGPDGLPDPADAPAAEPAEEREPDRFRVIDM